MKSALAPLPSRSPNGEPIVAVAPPAAPLFSPPNSAPPVNRAAAPSPAGARKHTIAPGDTLYRISVKYFGNGSKVDAIFNANRDVMSDKNTLLRVGIELKIP